MTNDKTEQPIPADELDRIAGDALYNCPKDAPAGSEAGRWKHGYIQGGKAEYARAHALPPSPVGEAAKLVAMKFYDWAMWNRYQRDKGGYYKMEHSDNGPWPHYVRKDVCETTEEFYEIFAATQPSPNASRAGKADKKKDNDN